MRVRWRRVRNHEPPPDFDHRTDPRLLDAVLRPDLLTFVGKADSVVSPGTPFAPTRHLEAIAHVLDEVEASRILRAAHHPAAALDEVDHGPVAFTAHLLGRHPKMRIISASYADSLSAKFANDTRRVMQSAWYRRAFPGAILKRMSEQELTTTAGGSRLATSVGGTLTGRGADLIVVDLAPGVSPLIAGLCSCCDPMGTGLQRGSG